METVIVQNASLIILIDKNTVFIPLTLFVDLLLTYSFQCLFNLGS